MQNIDTNNALRETATHGTPEFPLGFYIDDTRNFYNNDINWHWHKEFELAYISEGTIICHIDQHTYSLQSGDIIFINSGILHRFTSETYAIMPNIVFSPFLRYNFYVCCVSPIAVGDTIFIPMMS